MNVNEKTFPSFYAEEPSQPAIDVGKTGQPYLFAIVLFSFQLEICLCTKLVLTNTPILSLAILSPETYLGV